MDTNGLVVACPSSFPCLWVWRSSYPLATARLNQPGGPSLQRLFPRWRKVAQWQEQAQSIDAHLLSFYDNNVQGFFASIFFHFLGWLMGAAEVQFFFYLMGASVTPIQCLIIETMVQPMTVAGLVIPGSLGVQEAGGVFLCRLLGIDEGAGLPSWRSNGFVKRSIISLALWSLLVLLAGFCHTAYPQTLVLIHSDLF